MDGTRSAVVDEFWARASVFYITGLSSCHKCISPATDLPREYEHMVFAAFNQGLHDEAADVAETAGNCDNNHDDSLYCSDLVGNDEG